ncbi:MAG: NAD-dependent epimerase/dehydratase family protein [Patescibacteria group bacterium]|jgi:UDP-glucose 4-epimerase
MNFSGKLPARAVVTGGAGFIGSHLVDALVSAGVEVLVIDRSESLRVRHENPGARYIKADIADAVALDAIRAFTPEVAFHLAAQLSVPRSVANPYLDAEINILRSLQFLEAVKDAGVSKVIFASSGGAIVGEHPVRPTPLIDNAYPKSPYGVSKMGFEYFLESAGVPANSMRFSNIYGPRQQITKPMNEGGAIPLFLERMIVTKQPITLYGDGSATRDYLFVDDAVESMLLATLTSHNGTIQIATGQETSLTALLDHLFAVHEAEHQVEYLSERVGDIQRSALDPISGETILGWKAKTGLREGLTETYEWYRDTFRSPS